MQTHGLLCTDTQRLTEHRRHQFAVWDGAPLQLLFAVEEPKRTQSHKHIQLPSLQIGHQCKPSKHIQLPITQVEHQSKPYKHIQLPTV